MEFNSPLGETRPRLPRPYVAAEVAHKEDVRVESGREGGEAIPAPSIIDGYLLQPAGGVVGCILQYANCVF